MAGSHQVALLHGTSTVDFHFIHRNATALVQAVGITETQWKDVIPSNLPWHGDAIRAPCTAILTEAAAKGD